MAAYTQVLSNASATSAALQWDGGPGILVAVATWSAGNIKIQMLGPDGSTYIDTPASTTVSANGSVRFDLPPCTYKIVVATATAIYAGVYSYRTAGPM